jgi:hypothetical protein
MPPLGSGDGYSEITFNPAETSEWSNTQTINLNQTASPTPTPTVPEFPATLAITFLVMSTLAVAVVFRRKTQ